LAQTGSAADHTKKAPTFAPGLSLGRCTDWRAEGYAGKAKPSPIRRFVVVRQCGYGPLEKSIGETMKSLIVKRSIILAGHKTSVSLEDAFWQGLKDIATSRRMTLSDLVGSIDSERKHGNLSSVS